MRAHPKWDDVGVFRFRKVRPSAPQSREDRLIFPIELDPKSGALVVLLLSHLTPSSPIHTLRARYVQLSHERVTIDKIFDYTRLWDQDDYCMDTIESKMQDARYQEIRRRVTM